VHTFLTRIATFLTAPQGYNSTLTGTYKTVRQFTDKLQVSLCTLVITLCIIN
jgi:hypothetical protein